MNELLNIKEQLIVLLFFVVAILITPLIFIALDYWAGIRKAKKRHERIQSNRMKRTVDKVCRYYNAILAMMVLDCIQISGFVFLHMYNGWSAWTFPILTLAAVVFVACIEIKSILEPADVKEERDLKQVAALAKAITEHRNEPAEIAEAIAQYLTKKGGENGA